MQAGERALRKIWIDDVEYSIEAPELTGAAIRALAGKVSGQLFLDQPESPDIAVDESTVVQIKGGEQFRTMALAKDYKIFIDGSEYIVQSEEMTGEQIKKLADKPQDYKLYLERPGQPDKLIRDEEVVRIREGEHFHTVPPANFG